MARHRLAAMIEPDPRERSCVTNPFVFAGGTGDPCYGSHWSVHCALDVRSARPFATASLDRAVFFREGGGPALLISITILSKETV